MADWTTPQDVIDRWVGGNAPTDTDLLEQLILDAETIIKAEFPAIQTRIDDESLAQANVTLVTVRMVSRILRNPENLTYWQQATGPFSQGRNFGETIDIWMAPAERTLLAPITRGKAFSIDLGPDKVSPVEDIIAPRYDPIWKPTE